MVATAGGGGAVCDAGTATTDNCVGFFSFSSRVLATRMGEAVAEETAEVEAGEDGATELDGTVVDWVEEEGVGDDEAGGGGSVAGRVVGEGVAEGVANEGVAGDGVA